MGSLDIQLLTMSDIEIRYNESLGPTIPQLYEVFG